MERKNRGFSVAVSIPKQSKDGGAGFLKQLATTSGPEEGGCNFKQDRKVDSIPLPKFRKSSKLLKKMMRFSIL